MAAPLVHAEAPREGTRPATRVTPIWELNENEQQQRIAADLSAVGVYRDGLRSVIAFVEARTNLFPTETVKDPHMLSREQREIVWTTWKSFLDYTLALDTMGKYYRHYYRLRGENEDRAFLVFYEGFLAGYRAALEFIDRTEHDKNLDTLLNEPVPEIGLPKGTYSKLKFRFLNAGRGTEFVALDTLYHTKRLTNDAAVRQHIEEDRDAIWKMGRGRGEALTLKNAGQVVQKAGFAAYFPVQAGVSDWMGDTKVKRRNVSLVTEDQIRDMTKRLEPGDFCLVRHEWYLSNVGLPGFWPHAVLYIGTVEDRRKFFDDSDVREWVKSQGQASGDFEALLRAKNPDNYKVGTKPLHGDVTRVIEAISEGVSFNSIEHACDADSLVVLRPRLPKREKAMALLRAFHYAGRPYDFNFDFRTDSTLVCTELVYKSYEPATDCRGLRFPMVEMLGRPVLPANEIAKIFDAQCGTKDQQADFVLFLDGYEKEKRAVESTLDAFRESWKRPKWHVITQDEPVRESGRE